MMFTQSMFGDLLASCNDLEKVIEAFNQAAESQNKSKSITLKDALQPGYIVAMKIDGKVCCGIVLANRVVRVTTATQTQYYNYANFKAFLDGKVEGTTITGVYKPTANAYKTYEIDNMDVIWKPEDPKTELSIAEIEKKLGIKPGTLKIK